MNDKISVIVPIYNNEKYLKECIESIIEQSYMETEIILVDDGSTDKCPQICDEYAKKSNKIKVIHKKNGGVSSARNNGIAEATGEWISFVDSDDWIEPTYLEEMINAANKNKADIALCGYKRVASNDEKICWSNYNKVITSKEYLINCLNPQTGFGFCHMKLIKKDKIQNIKFDEKLKVGEDALFNIELSKNVETAVYVNKYLYNYRINMSSAVKKFDKDYPEKYIKSMKKISNYIEKNTENNNDIQQNLYDFIAFHVLLIAVNYCYNPENNRNGGKKSLSNICNQEPLKNAIKNSDYKNLSITRKMTLFTIKHKLYWITGIICKIRQIQNRRS